MFGYINWADSGYLPGTRNRLQKHWNRARRPSPSRKTSIGAGIVLERFRASLRLAVVFHTAVPAGGSTGPDNSDHASTPSTPPHAGLFSYCL